MKQLKKKNNKKLKLIDNSVCEKQVHILFALYAYKKDLYSYRASFNNEHHMYRLQHTDIVFYSTKSVNQKICLTSWC